MIFFKKLVIIIGMLLMFSPQLMAQDKHDGKAQDKHKKHKDNRQKYYCKDYREKYHHGHHRHYIRDSHGRYIPYYVEGFHEHCNNYSGYYDSQGSFIEIYVDGQGSSNVRLNIDSIHIR